MSDELKDLFFDAVLAMKFRAEPSGVTGRYKNDTNVTASLPDGWIWARQDGEDIPKPVRNLNVRTDKGDTPVRFELLEDGTYAVKGVDPVAGPEALGAAASDYNQPDSHAGVNPNLTLGRDFYPGRVRIWTAGTLKVNLSEPYPYTDSAGNRAVWTPIDANALDILSDVPSSSQQRWVQLALNPDATTPALVAFSGTAQSLALPLAPDGFKAISVTNGYIVLDAVILKTGDVDETTVTESRWRLARMFGGSQGGSSAPSTATYITQTPDAGLSAEQTLSALATGLLKNTTATGVLSIATNADVPTFAGANGAVAGSKGGVPAPTATDNVLYLRGDSTWAAPSGTGAPTSAKYITAASDATLSAEVVIPGLAGSADILNAGGAGTSEEFDSGADPLTWTPSNPTTHDVNTTVLSNLFIQQGDNTERFGTKSWSPAGAFDARVKLMTASDKAANTSDFASGLLIRDSGNTNRVLLQLATDYTNVQWIVQAFTYTASTYTQRGVSWKVFGQNYVYLRIVRDGSNNVSFWFSLTGVIYQFIATVSFSITVAGIGLRVAAAGGSATTQTVTDWLRTSV